jgi:DnaJ like chaperone protein
MGLSGKLLGAGIGFFLGGPLGAVVGGVIGHFVKDAPLADGVFSPWAGAEHAGDPRVRQQQQEFQFVASLVGILAAMIRVDGDVREEEVQAVRRFFAERLGYRGESLEIVKELLKQFLRDGVDLQGVCLDLRGRTDYATRLLLVECLEEVAGADGRIRDAERAILEEVARLLGVEARQAAGAGTQGSNGKDFRALGVEASATAEEIKSAYRELVKKYHPDKVGHLGEEFQELAHRKFLEIQGAYERVRAARGF